MPIAIVLQVSQVLPYVCNVLRFALSVLLLELSLYATSLCPPLHSDVVASSPFYSVVLAHGSGISCYNIIVILYTVCMVLIYVIIVCMYVLVPAHVQ